MNQVIDIDTLNLYRGSPRQVRYWALRALKVGLVPMIQGSPGIGKSAMIRSIANDMNLQVIDDRIATNGPEHYTGLPDVSGDKAVYKPFSVFPLEGDPLPKGKDGWLFFLDEFNSGLPTTMVGAYKFLLEREVGQKKLHEKVFIVAAGNRDEDRAITQSLGTALQRRIIWLEMFIDGTIGSHFDDFMHDVAIPFKWNSMVMAFLNYQKQYLNNFDPSHTEKTFACPGTWEFASRLADDEPVIQEDMPLYVGALGAGVGVEFVNFCQLAGNLPQLLDITSNPLTARICTDKGEQWMTISMLIEEATQVNLEDLGDYVDRYGLEFRILFWKSLQVRHPAWRREKAFIRAQTALARYLYEA